MTQNKIFDIEEVMKKVESLRNGFTVEHDFQFIMGVAIREIYPNANVIMEYKYPEIEDATKQKRQYIDILVIMDNKYYPIELKYKHKGEVLCISENIKTELSNQTCTSDHRKHYREDIDRLLSLKETQKTDYIPGCNFEEGYAIFLTNYENFQNKQAQDSIDSETLKKDKKYKKYNIDVEWKPYKTNTSFIYAITTIKKN